MCMTDRGMCMCMDLFVFNVHNPLLTCPTLAGTPPHQCPHPILCGVSGMSATRTRATNPFICCMQYVACDPMHAIHCMRTLSACPLRSRHSHRSQVLRFRHSRHSEALGPRHSCRASLRSTVIATPPPGSQTDRLHSQPRVHHRDSGLLLQFRVHHRQAILQGHLQGCLQGCPPAPAPALCASPARAHQRPPRPDRPPSIPAHQVSRSATCWLTRGVLQTAGKKPKAASLAATCSGVASEEATGATVAGMEGEEGATAARAAKVVRAAEAAGKA